MAKACTRCHGKGVYEWGARINRKPSYSGQCFKCKGTGIEPGFVDWQPASEDAPNVGSVAWAKLTFPPGTMIEIPNSQYFSGTQLPAEWVRGGTQVLVGMNAYTLPDAVANLERGFWQILPATERRGDPCDYGHPDGINCEVCAEPTPAMCSLEEELLDDWEGGSF